MPSLLLYALGSVYSYNVHVHVSSLIMDYKLCVHYWLVLYMYITIVAVALLGSQINS